MAQTAPRFDLSQQIIATVSSRLRDGDPVTAGRGAFYDKELKRDLGIRGVHQSVICTRVNLLVAAGVLRFVDTGRKKISGGSCTTKEYAVVELVPA